MKSIPKVEMLIAEFEDDYVLCFVVILFIMIQNTWIIRWGVIPASEAGLKYHEYF